MYILLSHLTSKMSKITNLKINAFLQSSTKGKKYSIRFENRDRNYKSCKYIIQYKTLVKRNSRGKKVHKKIRRYPIRIGCFPQGH